MNKKYKDLTIDDIHEIRAMNSKKFESMCNEEIGDYIKRGADTFIDRVKPKDTSLA
jgi:hypothetical protein